MRNTFFYCSKCGVRVEKPTIDWRCPRCGYPVITENIRTKKFLNDISDSFEITSYRRRITLGEGDTPVVKTSFKNSNVYLKLEYLNPTGSFKDRGTVTVISHYLETGKKGLVVDSSGNTAISVSAYSALVGAKSFIVVPKNAPEGKIAIIGLLGADIIFTDTREEASKKAYEIAMDKDLYYVSHPTNPFFIEGEMSIFVEIVKQVGCPHNIFLPVSSGTLLLGLYYGLMSVHDPHCHDTRLWAVQPTSNPTLAGLVEREVLSEGKAELTDALRVKNPPRIMEMANAVRETGGGLVTVNDEDVKEGLKMLFGKGFIVEPSSAVVLPAFFKALDNSYVDKNDINLLVLTGSGLKYAVLLKKLFGK